MKLNKIVKILLVGSFISFFTGFILLSYPILALIWNIVFPQTSSELAKTLAKPITTSKFEIIAESPEIILPKKDLSLPEIPQVTIPKIGVSTAILEASTQEYESALIKGVWRVPDFGVPDKQDKPVILVAHRFGYIAWSQNYRETNSFFNLPKLEVGDRIEIIWDQRKFEYEIYDSEDNTEITNYSADLILYTCKFLDSDIRIFRYAKRIN